MFRINKYKDTTSHVAASLVAICLLTQSGIVAADPKTSTNMSSRQGYVERLLTESSAARKIDESGDAEALDLKAQAASHFDDARRANERGDNETAQTELREAIRLMTAAVQAVSGDVAVSSKDASDFARRRESVKALADAHGRIASEKGEKKMNNALQEQVAADLAAADALLANGEGDEARAKLDGAYEAIKVSLESLRGGDTLVRELSFETKAEEYEYELDRNDTHRMLVTVLLAEKLESSPMRATAEKFIGESENLRSQAETAAGKKQYEEAIGLLEQSTKELIRAIRSAGIYIPG
jgi:tetratricopeptide (TPR) repeat protein